MTDGGFYVATLTVFVPLFVDGRRVDGVPEQADRVAVAEADRVLGFLCGPVARERFCAEVGDGVVMGWLGGLGGLERIERMVRDEVVDLTLGVGVDRGA